MGIQILKIAQRKAPISQRELPHKAQRAQNKDPYARPTPDRFRSQLGFGESWGGTRGSPYSLQSEEVADIGGHNK